jgi:hypothetical protein
LHRLVNLGKFRLDKDELIPPKRKSSLFQVEFKICRVYNDFKNSGF